MTNHRDTPHPFAPGAATPARASHPREALLAALPLEERRRELAQIPTAVLEGGSGARTATPLVLLHGPGGNAAHWLRVVPGLVQRHRLIVPDLPGHGRTQLGPGRLDADRVLAWLAELIEQTCAVPPVIVGELLGGAIALRFALRHPGRASQLVLADAFGLAPFQPAPEFARALGEFGARPSVESHDALWQKCAYDLPRLRRDLGASWGPFAAYNVERARSEEMRAAQQLLMAEFGLPALPADELARLTLPVTLLWGRNDLATPLAVAQAASARYGWPLHVIENANDAPAIEQPEAFVRALESALGARPNAGAEGSLPRPLPRERGPLPEVIENPARSLNGPEPVQREPQRRSPARSAHEEVDTLVIGGGQAGLSTSYWLRHAGIEHLVLERRKELGGSWPDRWDSFHLVAPNFTLLLPGMPYAGPDPDAFMPRDQVIDYVRSYAGHIGAPVRLGQNVERLRARDRGFEAQTAGTRFLARQVVLATGPYQQPKIPGIARLLPGRVQQLHSHDYRRPTQLAPGGVLVVGTGQSGTQIAEELLHAGRDVHLAVSRCWSVPRRYRGRDVIWWLYQTYVNGAKYGVHFPTVGDLPTPAARFACNPHCSGTNGGHDIHLRQFARDGMHLYGRLEALEGTKLRFSADLPELLAFADRNFDEEFRPLFDAYIAAAGVDAPPDDRPPPDDFTPPTITELDLDRTGIHNVVWATGYRLDFGWLELPILDEWGYPRHMRGVTEYPGLYAVGLPWLHSEPSSVFAGIGADTAYVVEQLARRRLEHGALRPGGAAVG